MVYGIGHGAQYYFGKSASALTPRECAFLAAMLPGPRIAYNPYKNLDKVLKRSDMILKLLKQRGVLGESEYQAAMASELNIAGLQRKVDQSVNQPPVFSSASSAQQKTSEKPDPGAPHPEADKPMTGDRGGEASTTHTPSPPEHTQPEKH
jgi:monofunctional biosynthetic peptidoglycan transglycosylase